LKPLATIWPLSLIAVALSRVNPGAGRDQVVEVLEHPSAPDPRPEAGLANDHAVVIDRLADWIKAEGPQVGHGIGGLGRCRRGWRDGDQTGDFPAED